MQCMLQKIDRTSKPIKKNTQLVTKNLEDKNIFLEQENFDILKLLQQKQPLPKGKDKKKETTGGSEKSSTLRTLGKRAKPDTKDNLRIAQK